MRIRQRTDSQEEEMGKKEALEYIDSKAELVTEVSDKIWGYAELSLMEHQSSEL